jgi:hypothetical protein
MDLTKLEDVAAIAEQPETIVILQRDGEPYRGPDGNPCTISFVGKDSKRGIATRDVVLRRMSKLSKDKQGNPREWQRNRVDQAAGLVVDWSGWTNGGEVAEPSPENVRALLGTLEHVLEQVEAGIAAHGAASNAGFFGQTDSTTISTS